MSVIKVYCYARCGTCRKALKWLADRNISFEEKAIRETPPKPAELKLALQTEDSLRRLLNTSSQDYRELGLKDRLDTLSQKEVFALLQANGNLVKRPFVVAGSQAWAGFDPVKWEERLA